jgi:hypothetical protein
VSRGYRWSLVVGRWSVVGGSRARGLDRPERAMLTARMIGFYCISCALIEPPFRARRALPSRNFNRAGLGAASLSPTSSFINECARVEAEAAISLSSTVLGRRSGVFWRQEPESNAISTLLRSLLRLPGFGPPAPAYRCASLWRDESYGSSTRLMQY